MTTTTTNNGVTNDRVLFITGTTGLVGGDLVRKYMDRGDRVYALVRAPSFAAAQERLAARLGGPLPPWVTAVAGDLTAPRLGIDDETWNALAQDITDVLHAGTDINFGRPLDFAREVNFRGAQRVIELARAAPRLRQVGHVSTVYVAGKRTGLILEDELYHSAGFLNTYEQTKYEAEVWLQDQMRDLPISIYRMSSVLGDARTGVVRQFNFLHQILRLLWGNLLPALPGDPESTLDMIASDWLADALTTLFDSRFTPGETLHLCSGHDRSFTLAELLYSTYEQFTTLYPDRSLPPTPELLGYEEFLEYVRETEKRGQHRLAQALGAMALFVPHQSFVKSFDNTKAQAELAGTGVVLPDIRDYHGRVVAYCLLSHWGRRPIAESPPAGR
ncbi:MAG: SDR family oxidoreductase [Anaerolineae bacterium]